MFARTRESFGLGLRAVAATALALGLAQVGSVAAAQAVQPAPASAPPVVETPRLEPGAPPLTRALDTSDRSTDFYYYDEYRLRLRRGEAVRIDMDSVRLDSVVDITGSQGGDPLGSNDDSTAGSLNSKLYFTAPADGDYIVRARGFRITDLGEYTVAVVRMPPAPAAIRLAPGRPVMGQLSEASPVIDESRGFGDDYRYALYTIAGRVGERVQITMTSGDLDSRLRLTGDRGFSLTDENGGGNLNARIYAVLPGNGQYTVWAEGPVTQSGPYRLEFASLDPIAEAQPQTLQPGVSTASSLGPNSGISMQPDGSGQIGGYFYQLYTLQLTQGQDMTVEVTTQDFYPVLEAGLQSPLGLAVAQSSDMGGRMARLVLRPTGTGPIVIRLRSLGRGRGGFVISVAEGAAVQAD